MPSTPHAGGALRSSSAGRRSGLIASAPVTECVAGGDGGRASPSRWMLMRSATSNTWGMLRLITMRGIPSSRNRTMSSRPGSVRAPRGPRWVPPDDDLGAEHHDTGDGRPLTAGEALRRYGRILQGRDPEAAQLLTGGGPHPGDVEHPHDGPEWARARSFAAEAEGARDVERGRHGQVLVHRLDPVRTRPESS